MIDRHTSTGEDDSSHLLIDDVERRDARASRIAIEEPVQSLALDPVPHTGIDP